MQDSDPSSMRAWWSRACFTLSTALCPGPPAPPPSSSYLLCFPAVLRLLVRTCRLSARENLWCALSCSDGDRCCAL